jgi:hypothetical protein
LATHIGGVNPPTQAHLTSSLRRRVVVPNPQPIQSRSPDRVPQSFLQDSPRTQQKANERRKGKHTRNPRRVSSLAGASVALLFLPGWWRALTRKWIFGYLHTCVLTGNRARGEKINSNPPCHRVIVINNCAFGSKKERTQPPLLAHSRRLAFGPFLYTVRDYHSQLLILNQLPKAWRWQGIPTRVFGRCKHELGYTLRDYCYRQEGREGGVGR